MLGTILGVAPGIVFAVIFSSVAGRVHLHGCRSKPLTWDGFSDASELIAYGAFPD
ncbi:MAG: hypothetical protein WA129_07410 [Acidovorax sp.]